MKKNKSTDTCCMATSLESNDKSSALAARVVERILELGRLSGERGITINEAEGLIKDHKPSSVSPRFAELIKRGQLVRILIGYRAPTKRFPGGIARYVSRYDEETQRNVTIHWLPEFAPKKGGTPGQTGSNQESPPNSDDGRRESGATQGVYL